MNWRRDLLVVVGANALCVVLLSLGMHLTLRLTPAGSLLIDSWVVRDDRTAVADVAGEYGDPLGLLTEVVPFWLTVVGCTVAVLVGGVVGWLAVARAFWLPLLAILPLTASPLLIDVRAADVWLRAALWGLLACLAAAAVRRSRVRRAERA